VFAGHGDFHQTRTRLAFHFHGGEFVLGAFEVVLHRLGLFHQTGDLAFHHGGLSKEMNEWECSVVVLNSSQPTD
jgi:hypothetical protein